MTKPKTLEQLRADKERAETQLAQELHKLERLENRKKYLEQGVQAAISTETEKITQPSGAATPRDSDAHKRIAVPRLSVFFESASGQGSKAAKFAVLIPGHAGFPKRVERSEGSDTTPTSHVQKVLRTERKNSNITKLQTEQRGPAGPRRLGAATRISASLSRGSLRSLGAPLTKPPKRQSMPF